MYQSIKALENRTWIVFNLVFANNTILSCFFFFFSIIDLYFLIPTVKAEAFNPIAELVKPTGTPTNEVKNGNIQTN